MTLRAYDVRLEHPEGRARQTVRVAAVDAREARAQAEHFETTREAQAWTVVAVRRSPYAVGASHRRARREWLEARA